ncbi:hypothetical protein K523DRAFT_326154 [Schizophyllum commune Tattone D]|nr:hypothetical protein K523DRAFT_326154 [Schizophyllum commune Tattone D]
MLDRFLDARINERLAGVTDSFGPSKGISHTNAWRDRTRGAACNSGTRIICRPSFAIQAASGKPVLQRPLPLTTTSVPCTCACATPYTKCERPTVNFL